MDVSSVSSVSEIDLGKMKPTRTEIVAVAILCYVNLINYMDRYTVSGILNDIGETFDLTDAQKGLLQTAFIGIYMIMAPVYGFLGDRYNRKILLAVGIFIWSGTMLASSFMPTYGLFLTMRCFVGIGEASYSTIAPTLISDMFVGERRSKMLALFYFAIPVGSGLGYILGAEVADFAEQVLPGDKADEAWRWSLRVTPVLSMIAFFLILFVLQEPPRGKVEGAQNMEATSYKSDLKYLFTNKSYVLITAASTCVAYVAGALAWWVPSYVESGAELQEDPNIDPGSITLFVGVSSTAAGLIGVPLGAYLGRRYRGKYPAADTIVCGIGMALSTPLLVGALFLADVNLIGFLFAALFGQILLNLNWAVVSDIVLYISIPTRRSSAEAFQILITHALGDAGSPYIVGVVADALKPVLRDNHTGTTEYINFLSLQYSMVLTSVIDIFGAIFFIWCALYLENDKKTCDEEIAACTAQEISMNKLPSASNEFSYVNNALSVSSETINSTSPLKK